MLAKIFKDKAEINRCINTSVFLIFITFIFLLFTFHCYSNNINVSNVTTTGKNTTLHYTMVNFDINWDNSWRTSTFESNWDAAWIFIKYRVQGSMVWNHATLNVGGHTAPTGSTIDTPNDGKGVFMYKSANGIGSNNWTNAQLQWNYGVDGVNDNDSIEVCLFAIEMVYVPTGAFYLGDGSVTNIEGQFEDGISGNPLKITSEGAITLGGGGAGSLGNNNASGMNTADDFNDITTQTLPATFPKGINPYYIMKYEITQEQYVEFLNKLTRTQQASRITTIVGNYMYMSIFQTNTPQSRNGIRLIFDPGGINPRIYGCDLNNNGIAGESTDGQNIACNWLSWADLAAYLDWSGLRPMTELEFEKACRGTLVPVANECAWGDTIITGATGIINSGANNEIASNSGANCVCTIVSSPMRVGNFAQIGTNRHNSGGSYYGIMELSGNLLERPITIGNFTGRAFTGNIGDGSLDVTGNANVLNWPTSTAVGVGLRGGSYTNNPTYKRVSDRISQSHANSNGGGDYGGRGVRTACIVPSSVTASASPNPICEGATLILTGSATGGTTWSWTGPNGFTSTLQNPTISGINSADAGVYTLTASNTCGVAYPVNTSSVIVDVLSIYASAIATPATICNGSSTTLGISGGTLGTGATWNWYSTSCGVTSAGVGVSLVVTLTSTSTYWVRAEGICNTTGCATIIVTVDTLPAVPTAGTHTPSQTQIVWNWNTVSNATGYQWSTTTTYPGTGVNTIASPTYTQTGLTCNTAYTLYIWAYNVCGNSSTYTTLTQTTSSCAFVCGNNLVINHVAGVNGAPETKTVTYGTVSTNLSGATRCWITQNLGADNQPSSATDNTNAAAGWYFQFNLPQGYKVGPVPAWTITTINQNSDWIAANDPCTIMLGSGWRVPTYTEWNNADLNGPWANQTDAYNSVLKLHIGGSLFSSDGSLFDRSIYGKYWSSTQASTTGGWRLSLSSSSSMGWGINKAFGYSLRCINP